jgi:transcription elongation GreA/GreB family factor
MKSDLIAKIAVRLEEMVALYDAAARKTHAEATDEENRAEDKYDTRGLEASYLAQGQINQLAETVEAVAQFRRLRPRTFAADEAIDVGACVELAGPKEKSFLFIGPCAGGTEVEHEGHTVLVLTPQSPLGRQLVGRKAGEKIAMRIGGFPTSYRIAAVS